MTRGMSRKFNSRSRNACTATSLAALRMAGISPPARAAACASTRLGKRPKSGAQKSKRAVRIRSRKLTPQAIRPGHASAWAIGVRMSGEPNCASIEPSTYSTSECTMLCRWTTTSTCPGARPKSRHASISSRPLFMSVAESTEIFRPITHFGCAQACSGVTAASASCGVSRKGPPEAVNSTRRTPGALTPAAQPGGKHWNIALCSLSTGKSAAPEARTAARSSGPAMTRDSLLASSTRLPACAAASVERKPADPAMPAITTSASGSDAISMRPSAPPSTRVGLPDPASRAVSSRAASTSASAANAGRSVRTCCASFAALRFAPSATTLNLSVWRASTSSVFSPMDPVEPRTATPITPPPRSP